MCFLLESERDFYLVNKDNNYCFKINNSKIESRICGRGIDGEGREILVLNEWLFFFLVIEINVVIFFKIFL